MEERGCGEEKMSGRAGSRGGRHWREEDGLQGVSGFDAGWRGSHRHDAGDGGARECAFLFPSHSNFKSQCCLSPDKRSMFLLILLLTYKLNLCSCACSSGGCKLCIRKVMV